MNRFHLEDEILAMANTSDDINLIVNAMIEDQITYEEAAEALKGISRLHLIKTNKLFDCFKKIFDPDEPKPNTNPPERYTSEK